MKQSLSQKRIVRALSKSEKYYNKVEQVENDPSIWNHSFSRRGFGVSTLKKSAENKINKLNAQKDKHYNIAVSAGIDCTNKEIEESYMNTYGYLDGVCEFIEDIEIYREKIQGT
jgi:hypothetical protein